MTDRPILFNGPMVNAILGGQKTQTRRVLKPQPKVYLPNSIDTTAPMQNDDMEWGQLETTWTRPTFTDSRGEPEDEIWHPIKTYQVGDRLYVREAWRCDRCYDFRPPRDIRQTAIFHEADGQWCFNNYGSQHGYVSGKFRQGMHMPRWASRLTLVVTDVRVQRLQEISGSDCFAEGIKRPACLTDPNVPMLGSTVTLHQNAKNSFRELWNSINDARGFGWDANPWVVAVTFETHKCNIDQMGTT